jgi:ribonuclease P protein component
LERLTFWPDRNPFLKRRFRLTRSNDFLRVRRTGKSYAHPLIVLIALPNQYEHSRVAVAAGRSIGKAVQRNRAKRLLRHAIRPLLPMITPSWDIVLVARRPISSATLQQTEQAVRMLLSRANLVQNPHVE